MIKDLSLVFQSDDSLGALYISSLPTAQSLPLLQEQNIRTVLSAARGVRLTNVSPHLEGHLTLPANDHPHFEISQFFDESYTFIEQGRKKGNVLVHCVAGISRSATLVAAYLIRKYRLNTNAVIALLQAKRQQVNPNPGFVIQLKLYQIQLLLPAKKKKEEDCTTTTSTQGAKRRSSRKSNLQFIMQQNQSSKRESVRGRESALLPKKEAISGIENKFTRSKSVLENNLETTNPKTLQKIQKLKAGMVNKLIHPAAGFNDLLKSNIYKNKLRIL